MNTIFKFYFQAWTLLAVGSGCALYYIGQNFRLQRELKSWMRWLQPAVGVLWTLMFLFFCLLGLVYPLVAPGQRVARYDAVSGTTYLKFQANLDGMEYLRDCQPPLCDYLYNSAYVGRGDYEAIRWLNEHVQGAPVIAEAVGNSYSSYGRVSVFTGLPDVVNWLGHESQWRAQSQKQLDDLTKRQVDMDILYTSIDPNQIQTVLARYGITYIYVGPLEYQKYAELPAVLTQYRASMDVVYDAQGVTIFQVRK
jgi:uncharacterized membrane protein